MELDETVVALAPTDFRLGEVNLNTCTNKVFLQTACRKGQVHSLNSFSTFIKNRELQEAINAYRNEQDMYLLARFIRIMRDDDNHLVIEEFNMDEYGEYEEKYSGQQLDDMYRQVTY